MMNMSCDSMRKTLEQLCCNIMSALVRRWLLLGCRQQKLMANLHLHKLQA